MFRRDGPAHGLSTGLGWLSLALGATESAAPSQVSRLVGTEPTRGTQALVRALGGREIVAGVGIFAIEPTAFLWARVAGDAMDVALVANALRSGGNKRRAVPALAVLTGVCALDVLAAARRTTGNHAREETEADAKEQTMNARSAVTLNAPAAAVYAAWRDFGRFPEFMYHVSSVTVTDGRSHWVVNAPGGGTVAWDAEITDDVPEQRIAWRSLPGTTVDNRGDVRFRPAPGGRGTEVHVEISYKAPAGALGSTVAKLLGEEPSQQVSDDLRRFKQLVETGEIARSDAAAAGTATPEQAFQPPAQPSMATEEAQA